MSGKPRSGWTRITTVFIAALLFATLTPAQNTLIAVFNSGSSVFIPGAFPPDRPFIDGVQAGYVSGEATPPYQGIIIVDGAGPYSRNMFTERRGWTAYRFPVDPGYYMVEMHFSETEHHWRGMRRFSVSIESEPVIEDLDIWNEVEGMYHLLYRFPVEIASGETTLDVEAFADVGQTTISGIGVIAVSPETQAPSPPPAFRGFDGYEMNVLSWHFPSPPPNTVDDLAGFRVYRCTGDCPTPELITPELVHGLQYLDRDLAVGVSAEYHVTSVDIWGNESIPTPTVTATPLPHSASTLPIYELEITDENRALLAQDIQSDEYVPCVFRYNGREWNAEVRFRGGATRGLDKKNWKVRFPEDDLFFGRRKLNLQAGMADPSMIRDGVAYALFENSGVLTPARRYVHLNVNGEFHGVYLDVEQLDEAFLASRDLDPYAEIFNPHTDFRTQWSLSGYINAWERETREDSLDYSRVINLIETINLTPPNRRAGALLAQMNIDSFLRWYGTLIITADRDFVGGNNYAMFDPHVDRWQTLNWDHSGAFIHEDTPLDVGSQAAPSPITGSYNRMVDAVLTTPHLRAAHTRMISDLLASTQSPEVVLSLIEQVYDEISADASRDFRKQGRADPEYFYFGRIALENFVPERFAYINAHLGEHEPNLGPAAQVIINEVMSNNVSTVMDDHGNHSPWIELLNAGDTVVDLGNLILTPNPDRPFIWKISQSVPLQPGESHILWADGSPGLNHTRFALDPDGGEDLTLFDENAEHILSQIRLPSMLPDQSLGCAPDGALNMVFQGLPTPDAPNIGPPDRSPIQLNEIVTNNWGLIADEQEDFDPWLEIHNASSEAVNLGDITLRQGIISGPEWEFPSDLAIPANGFLIVWLDGEPIEGNTHADFEVTDDAGTLALIDEADGSLISRLDYPALASGQTFGRFLDGRPLQHLLTRATPSEPNVYLRSDGAIINEFMALNATATSDEAGDFEDWVEILNPRNESVFLANLFLTDDVTEPTRWPIPDIATSTLDPGARLVIWLDDEPTEGPYHANFRLSADGEDIALFTSDGLEPFDLVTFSTQVVDTAQARIGDGSGEFHVTALPTPNTPNALALSLEDIADVILGRRSLTIQEFIEGDESGNRIIEITDIVLRSLFLATPTGP